MSRNGNSQIAEVISLVKTLAVFFGIAFLLRASVVEAFKIPSESMVPTLEEGDHILVNKLSYGLRLPFLAETVFDFRTPKRGDVVVFTLPDNPSTPEDESDTNIIKRVIGTPNDIVEVKGMNVIINGQVYDKDKDYAIWMSGGAKDFGPVKIPPGKIFMLGDNRDFSRDSRFWEPSPFLDVKRVKGRAFFIYYNSKLLFRRMLKVIH